PVSSSCNQNKFASPGTTHAYLVLSDFDLRREHATQHRQTFRHSSYAARTGTNHNFSSNYIWAKRKRRPDRYYSGSARGSNTECEGQRDECGNRGHRDNYDELRGQLSLPKPARRKV